MALQDKFDSAFTNKLLKKALLSPAKTPTTTANDNNYELTKSNLVTLSNSYTSLQNAFNKIYAHTLNVRNLHQYDEKRLSSISRQNKLETKIAPGNAPITSTSSAGDTLATTAATLDELSLSVEKLNEKMKKINLSGNGYSNAPLLGDGIGTNSRSRMGRIGGRALGVAGIGLDVFGRYQDGQSAGQIVAGTGGGLAGAALGAQAGAALGAFGGPAAPVTVPLGAFVGGALGYFGGSAAGDTAYNALNTRATGGGVKAGGSYVIGERGPEVLMLGGLSGRVIANGQRGKVSQAEKNLNTAADKSSRAAAKVTKGQPIGPTSYSSKFSNYLSSLFGNMPTWLNRIKDWLGMDSDRSRGTLGAGQYSAVGDISQATGDWKNDGEFLDALDRVARSLNVDSRDLLGLMQSESGIQANIANPNNPDAVGLIQFTRAARSDLGVTREQVLEMSRAQQMELVERHLRNAGLPNGANAGQLYAAVYLPGIARNKNYSGVLTRAGEAYYNSNRRLDENGDGVIDIGDLARELSNKRVEIGLGPSPSLTGGVLSAQGFVTPVSGGVGSGFGMRNLNGVTRAHEGLDYPIPSGSEVRAAKGGTIIRAEVLSGYGNTIEVDHGGGVTSLYAHLSRFAKTRGAVLPGEVIAYSGGGANDPGRGTSTGSHLHFELRLNGRSVDPAPYLSAPAAPVQRTPTTSLPSGYTAVRQNPITRQSGNYIRTPSGQYIPASAQNATDVPGYMLSSAAAKQEIDRYFQLRRRQ